MWDGVGVRREEPLTWTTGRIELRLSRLGRLINQLYLNKINVLKRLERLVKASLREKLSLILDVLNLRCLSHIQIKVKSAPGV